MASAKLFDGMLVVKYDAVAKPYSGTEWKSSFVLIPKRPQTVAMESFRLRVVDDDEELVNERPCPIEIRETNSQIVRISVFDNRTTLEFLRSGCDDGSLIFGEYIQPGDLLFVQFKLQVAKLEAELRTSRFEAPLEVFHAFKDSILIQVPKSSHGFSKVFSNFLSSFRRAFQLGPSPS